VRDRRLPSWPLGVWAALLGLTTLVLASDAVVTFPCALATGALLLLCLSGAKEGSFSRHYAIAALLSLAAILVTLVWQRAGS